jgi:undecaprenyl-diphosphatase
MSLPPDRARSTATIAGGLALFGLCAVVASSGEVSAPERQVFEAINGLPGWLAPPASGVQLLGILVVGPIVAGAALLARRPWLALAALLVTGLKLGAERVVWNVLGIHRERPGVTEPNAILRGGAPSEGVSFVSGHVVLVTGLAWVIVPYLPRRWRPVPWVVVALVAWARIYLGAHNPLDVVGGFGLGTAIGVGVDLLLRPRTPHASDHARG